MHQETVNCHKINRVNLTERPGQMHY